MYYESDHNIILENELFRLLIGADASAQSLIHKATGTECLMPGETMPLFSLTEERPYNNEIKLAHPNKKTTFSANRVRLDGSRLIIGFELITFEAVVGFCITPSYISFALTDFIIKPEDFGHLAMTPPPVLEFRLLQLPVKDRKYFGEWLNASWDEQVAVNVLGACPYTRIDAEKRNGCHILTADTLRDFRLKNCAAALIVTSGDGLADAIEAVEIDYDLPRGVQSRRDPRINASIYRTYDINPETVDEHIAYAKQGGFSMMLITYVSLVKEDGWYSYCGDYDFLEQYPDRLNDVRRMLDRIKAAGITPGLHFLHSHIGKLSRYVTPAADHRLHLTRHFTLAKPLDAHENIVYVEQNPEGTVTEPRCRVLKFGKELISYESYTTEWPYCFTGCKRGHWDTEPLYHEIGTIGGILDISEFGADSVHIDQDSGLQDEIADKIAKIYDTGFEFVYFDGSEGTNAPFEIYIPLAQYRVYRKLKNAPIFCEGAAKAHFSWHMLSGGNAFDIFRPKEFKQKLLEHAFEEAPRMAQDLTRLNFGWWNYFQDSQPDQFEFGTSRAAAWDCPGTMFGDRKAFRSNPRTKDNLEVLRRWEDMRAGNLLTAEMKQALRNPNQEHILLLGENGGYELLPYDCIPDAAGKDPGLSAYIFERNGQHCVVCWHTSGSGVLKLPFKLSDGVYEEEPGGEQIPLTAEGEYLLLPVAGRRYFRSNTTREQLIRAFEEATLITDASAT